MANKFLIFLFLNVFIFSSFVLAYDIQNFDTEVEVYSDGVAKVTNDLILDSTKINKVSIPVYSPESVIVTDNDGEIKFAILENIIVIQPRIKESDYELTLRYLTNSLTSKEKNEWFVNYLIPAYEKIKISNIKEARLTFSLPNTVTITSFSDGGIVFTEYNRMKIGWKLELKKDKSIKIESTYKNSPKIAGIDYIKIAFYILLAILFTTFTVFCIKKSYCKIMKRLTKGKKDIIRTLDNKEKKIVNLLLEKKNQLYQSIIQKETGINKATLSRLIKRLENRKIIEVRPSGNTNLIILQDWFVKK